VDEPTVRPRHGRLSLHLAPRPARVERLLSALEDVLAPFAPRPHWGKLFLAEAAAIAARYERFADFAELLARLDPRGAFRNDWLETRLLGARGREILSRVGGR